MGYIDDFESGNRAKIPYDDTPISRTTEESFDSRQRKTVTGTSRQSRWFVLFLAISLVLNICLCIATVHYILHGTQKTVNQNNNNITINGDYSPIVAATAMQSAVRVAAGGDGIVDEITYYKNTLSHGSGVIYKIDRANKIAYFITCYHVIEGYEKQVSVMLPTSLKPLTPPISSVISAYGLTTLGYSTIYDVAVLQYKYSSSNDPIEDCVGLFDNEESPLYEESYYLSQGETVFAVGDPLPGGSSLSGGLSISSGLISRLNIMLKIEDNSYYTRENQFTAESNPGNSGGGLFNNKGEFVGLVNSKLTTAKPGGTTIPVEGMAYSIPGTLAVGIAKSIINERNNRAVYIDLGANFVHDIDSPITQIKYNDKFIKKYGVIINSINAGSLALNYGLKSGDIVNSITYTDRSGVVHEDVPMLNMYIFDDIKFDIMVGSDITFKITRPALREDLTVTVKATATRTVN